MIINSLIVITLQYNKAFQHFISSCCFQNDAHRTPPVNSSVYLIMVMVNWNDSFMRVASWKQQGDT